MFLGSAPPSFVESVIARIIANLRLSLSNVSIFYDDIDLESHNAVSNHQIMINKKRQ